MFEEHIGRLSLLHHARQRVAENKLLKKELMDTFYAEHGLLFFEMNLADDVLKRNEADVREEALVLYNTIPNLAKTAIPGITIRESKVVGYDPAVALEWAIKHQVALSLDEGTYKKLVLAGQAPGSVDVTLTVAIASDLSEFGKGG